MLGREPVEVRHRAEQPLVPEAAHAGVRSGQLVHGRQRGCRIRRRQAGGKQIGSGLPAQSVDDLSRATHVAADHAKGFGQRADLGGYRCAYAEVIDDASPVRAEDASTMCVVDDQHRVRGAGNLRDLVERRQVAIH